MKHYTANPPQQYRPDIDGLRGIAILSVIGFHALPNTLSGGFIGVDIFFVISGFLISSIILTSLTTGKFTFTEFYSRRIKRIFPALILVLFSCVVMGWFLLLDREYRNLGVNVTAASGFSSNLYLWQSQFNYFESANSDNSMAPLLHLWSLGVEEQFYLIWPLLLYITWKKRLNILPLAAITAIGSFLLCVSWSGNHQMSAYYSPVTRFWEILFGFFCAYFTIFQLKAFVKIRQSKIWNTKACSNILAIAGVILIITGLFSITRNSIFPGWIALLPVCGAGLLISAGPTAYINKKILSHKLLVWFGLISYPLYLWHLPLLAFLHMYQLQAPGFLARLACIFLSIFLAWLSYIYIEKPIRFGKKSSFKPIMLCILMTGSACIGFSIYKLDGLASRFPKIFAGTTGKIDKEWRAGECFMSYKDKSISKSKCVSKTDGKMFFLWGDSIAGGLYPGMKHLQESHGIGLAQFTTSGCPPLLNWTSSGPNCKLINNDTFSFIKKLKPDVVLMLFNWGYHDNPHQYLRNTVEELHKAGIPRIVLIGPPPSWNYRLQNILYNRFFMKSPSGKLPDRMHTDLNINAQKYIQTDENYYRSLEVEYISAYNAMCNNNGCLTILTNEQGNQMVTTYDTEHITPLASIWLVNTIQNELLSGVQTREARKDR